MLQSAWTSVADAAGPTRSAQPRAAGVAFAVLIAVLALLWHRRAFLRRRCRELQHGKDHGSQQHGKDHGAASGPDTRSLLGRKQSA